MEVKTGFVRNYWKTISGLMVVAYLGIQAGKALPRDDVHIALPVVETIEYRIGDVASVEIVSDKSKVVKPVMHRVRPRTVEYSVRRDGCLRRYRRVGRRTRLLYKKCKPVIRDISSIPLPPGHRRVYYAIPQ
ncbi:hypothetical protein ACFL0V_06875 [Nanoarchaeota archaeon]